MPERIWKHPLFIPSAFAVAKLLLHLYVNAFAGYGYFRDELYYIVSTNHLAAGYVDHPPLSIYILAVSNLLFGTSLFAVRLLPAIVSSAVVFLAGYTARELGGGKLAQSLACLGSFIWLALMAYGTFYSMNSFDMLFWGLALLQLVRLVRDTSQRNWLLLGVLLGLGLLNKIGVLWLGAGIAAGIVLTPLRTELRRSGPWLAAAAALLLFSPYVIWNALNGWPHAEFIRNATTMKYGGVTAFDFLTGQLIVQHPFTGPLWIAGLFFFLRRAQGPLRIVAIAYFVCLLILALNGHSKPDYLSPFYMILFAAGGVQLEQLRTGWQRSLAVKVYPVVMLLGLFLAPVVLPILPVETYVAYSRFLPLHPANAEGHELQDLPQFYADMFGWDEMAQTVADVYTTLTPEEQALCVIFGQNYGEASAVTFFGGKLGLPPAVSGHNSYFLWGPGSRIGEVTIIIGGGRKDYEEIFAEVSVATVHTAPYAMPYENNLPIFVCRGPRMPLKDIWPRVKHYM